MKKNMHKRIVLSLLPMMIILTLIYLYPLINVCVSAFWGFTGSNAGRFVGLNNFSLIRKDIAKTVITTVVWTFGSVLPALVLGLILALICNDGVFGKKVVVSIGLLPYAIPLIIVASCWRFVYNPDFGLINVFLKKLGIITKSVSFLDYKHALVSVIVARIWRAMPFAFMNYYSALTTISAELYDAAKVDGADYWQSLFYITLPNLRKITMSTLIVLTVWTFMVFDIIYGMTGGGPIDATKTLPMRIYQEMFSMKNMGTSSAWSLIAIVILFLISCIYWNIQEKGEGDV